MQLVKVIKISALGILFLAVLGYTYLKTKDLITGVRLEIQGLSDNASYLGSILEITGQAKKSKELAINGDEVFVSPEGNFRDWRILLPGYNIITIAAKDRFGKETSEIYKVTYNL